MDSFQLNIAGYVIQVSSGDRDIELNPSPRFRSYICSGFDPYVFLKVTSGDVSMPEGAEKVFHAPYVEEHFGTMLKIKEEFWSVYRYHSDLFILTTLPLRGDDKKAKLRFSLTSRDWEVRFENGIVDVDPLEYPLDGLILYYLTVISNDIFIHASGVTMNRNGYVFSGISGKGKTTISKIWSESGASVIHDDRLVIRHSEGSYRMYNTPVYLEDQPSSAPVTRIYLLEHGRENMVVPVSGAKAASLVMANCIQNNWNREIVARHMGAVSLLCSSVPCFKLHFRPDRSVLDFLLDYE